VISNGHPSKQRPYILRVSALPHTVNYTAWEVHYVINILRVLALSQVRDREDAWKNQNWIQEG
jgi:hypothetical protein